MCTNAFESCTTQALMKAMGIGGSRARPEVPGIEPARFVGHRSIAAD